MVCCYGGQSEERSSRVSRVHGKSAHGPFLLAAVLAIAVISGACSRVGPESARKNGTEAQQPQGETAGGGLVAFVKNQKLVNFPSRTIGHALDHYPHLTKKEWKEVPQKSGHISVVFTGWFDLQPQRENGNANGNSGRGIEVMFLVEPSGAFYVFMVNLLEVRADGVISRHPYPDNAAVLSRIYENERILF